MAIAIGAFIGVACAAPPAQLADAGAGRTIRIQMTDFAFSPTRILLRPGERVTLTFENRGTAEHEFMAGTGSMPGAGFMRDWLGEAKLGPMIESDHAAGHTGTSVRVAAKGTATFEILVPPQVGEIEFGCFIADHYERGMHGVIMIDQGRAPNAVPSAGTDAPASPPSAPEMTAMPHPSGEMGGMGDEGH